jgi:DNA-directed RNA polymerase subunit RPC12/RpoP
MKYICAWCKKPIRETDEEPIDKISHSMCEDCKKKMRSGGFEGGKFTFDVRDERTA